jgi:hypothetical protein
MYKQLINVWRKELMEARVEIVDGKRRVVFTRRASGVDKMKEAVLLVMGPGYKFKDEEEQEVNKK